MNIPAKNKMFFKNDVRNILKIVYLKKSLRE